MATLTFQCPQCGNSFRRNNRDVAKKIRYGHTPVCSRKCASEMGNARRGVSTGQKTHQCTREKRIAQKAIENALKAGRLTRQPCERCGASKVHAHHDDYSKPFDVTWLCPKHHKERHRELDEIAAVSVAAYPPPPHEGGSDRRKVMASKRTDRQSREYELQTLIQHTVRRLEAQPDYMKTSNTKGQAPPRNEGR